MTNRWTGALAAVPLLVWLAVAGQTTAGVLGAWIVPPLLIPDEIHHFDLAELVGTTGEIPAVGDRTLSSNVLRARFESRRDEPHTLENDVPREQRWRLEEMLSTRPAQVNNRATQHPPLYYAFAGTVVTTVSDGLRLAWDQHIWLYRVLNVLLVAPVPVIAFLVARRLTACRAAQAAAALVPLAVPAYLFRAVPMINNDAMLILLISVASLLLLRVATGDMRVAVSVSLGFVTGAAMLTKAYGLVVLCVLPLGYVVAWLNERRHSDARTISLRAAAAVSVAVAVGGWWWVRNIIVYATLQPAAADRVPPAGGLHTSLGEWLSVFVRAFNRSFWLFLPSHRSVGSMVAAALTLVVVAMAGIGFLRARGRPWLPSLLLAVPAALIGGAALWSYRAYLETAHVGGAQGRYAHPALCAIAGLIAAGVAGLSERARRWAAPTIALVGVALSGAHLVNGLNLWYQGPAGWLSRLQSLFAWSPWPAWTLKGALGAAVILAVVLPIAALRGTRQPRPVEAGPPAAPSTLARY